MVCEGLEGEVSVPQDIAEFFSNQIDRVIACDETSNDIKSVGWAYAITSFFYVTRQEAEWRALHMKTLEIYKRVDNSREKQQFKSKLDERSNDMRTCDNCMKDMAKFKCTRCLNVYYCSAVCQKEKWKSHKLVCTPPKP